MLENLIYTNKKSLLTKELEAGNVPENAIAFIGDTKEIYALGLYYGGGYTKEEMDEKVSEIETKVNRLEGNIPEKIYVEDVLTSTSLKNALSANMGRALVNGNNNMPIILLAGTICRSSATSTTWYFIGSSHSAITSENPTATVNGGVIRFLFNAVDGRSILFVSVTANVQATGEATSYTNTEYKVRSGGANWLYTYSAANSLYIRGWCLHSQNGDSAASSALQWDGTASDGITRISVIAVGYAR